MDCSKIQQDILNGVTNKEMEQHLKDCAECKMFQDSLEQFLAARPPEEKYIPPEKLDYEIKREARLFIEKHMKAYNAGDHAHTPMIPRLTSYFAAAACSALVAWLVILALQPATQDKGTDNQSDNDGITTISTVADNQVEPVSWENVSMDEDFFTVTTDIEMNYILLLTPFPEETNEEEEEELTIDDEDNWS